MEGVGDKVESMEDAVFISDGWLGEVVVAEFDRVKEEKSFGGGVDDVEAAVVIEGGSNVEAIAAVKGPGLACAGFVVDEDWAANGADGSGVKVDGSVVGFPGGHFRGQGGLAKEVEGEFCLGKKLVPKEVGGGFGETGKDAEAWL